MTRYSLYIITFVLAAASILYELLLAQTISLLAGNTVVWYSITVGLYLATMGAGALLYQKLFPGKSPLGTLFVVELLLVAAGGLAVPIVHAAHMIAGFGAINNLPFLGMLVFPSWSVGMIGIIGILSGMELPLLIALAERALPRTQAAGRILGVDYLGSLLGAVVFPLVFLPRMETIEVGLFVAFFNLVAAIALLAAGMQKGVPFRKIGAVVFLGVALITALSSKEVIERYFLEKYYGYGDTRTVSQLFLPEDDVAVERFRSPYQKIDIARQLYSLRPEKLAFAYTTKYAEHPGYPRDVWLYLNGDFQLVSDVDEIYHEWFAHVPIVLAGTVPRYVLVLGGGDGLLAKELLKYDAIEHITQVDIDETVVEIARTHPALTALNGGSLSDERVKIVIEDAFRYVKETSERFDAVYIDFPYPKDYTLARLYSKEFYRMLSQHLAEGGFIALDAPGIEPIPYRGEDGFRQYYIGDKWPVYYHTLKAAGFATVVPFQSALELDNQQALDAVEEYYLNATVASTTERMKISEGVLQESIDSFTQGFIFAIPPKAEIPFAYHDPGVPLHVLNGKRFALSKLPYPGPEEIDPEQVHSIFKPRILDFSQWIIRFPY